MNKPKYKVGQWVAFIFDDEIIISEITGVVFDSNNQYGYHTSAEFIYEDSILEAR